MTFLIATAKPQTRLVDNTLLLSAANNVYALQLRHAQNHAGFT
jgi:hypothetical protein